MTQLINLLIYITLFLNINISAGNISLWLVVIIVANKISDSVLREEFPELRG